MNEDVAPASGTQIYKRLLSYIVPYWKAFILAIVCNAAYGFIDVQFVSALKPLLDEGLYGKNVEFLATAPLFVIVALSLRGTFGFIAAYCMSWIGNNMIMSMRKELFNQYLASLPV